jgi:predicted transcriptional regulator
MAATLPRYCGATGLESKLEEKDDERTLDLAYQKLRVYTALDHRIRIRAIFLIADNPGISFNELVKRTKVPTGKLAYHLALLGSGDLIAMKYERKGKVTSHYYVTRLGERMVRELRAETCER